MSNSLSLGLALRTFTDAFKFEGRSTRTQVVAFQILTMLANTVTVTLVGSPSPTGLLVLASTIWTVFWTFSWLSLSVRRFHDQNRSGWWAMVDGLVILSAIALLAQPAGESGGPSIRFGSFARTVASTPLTTMLSVVFVGAMLASLIMMFLPETPGSNRFGPDPRLESDLVEFGSPVET